MITEKDTLVQLLRRNYWTHGDKKVAIRKKGLGIWWEYTWKYHYEQVKYLSLGLLKLGFQTGDKATISGDNAPEWLWAEFAIQTCGGIPVGLFADSLPKEIAYVFNNSQAKFAIVHDQEQVDKYLTIKGELTNLERIIYWEPKGLWNYTETILVGFEEVLELGKQYDRQYPGTFEDNIDKVRADDYALLSYTSGTTGVPKGVPVAHRNFVALGKAFHQLLPYFSNRDDNVSTMPMGWAPGQWYEVAVPLTAGIITNFCEGVNTVQTDRREIAPTIQLVGAKLFEIHAAKIRASMMDAGLLKRFMYHLCLPIGYKVADLRYSRIRISPFWRILHSLAYLSVFRPLKDKLAFGHVKVAITAGAFLASNVFRYFQAIGVNIMQAYGLSETGLATHHRYGDIKYESAGVPLPGVELRISEENEILIRSEIAMESYWMDPKSTEEKIKQGWVYTGDAGHIDNDGHLIVIDRLADLVELADGEKFSPAYIESRLRFSPYIREVMSIGGRGYPYVAAIISIDFDNVTRWAEANKIPYTTLVDLSQKPEVCELIGKEINGLNRALSQVGQVKRFVNLHKDLDADDAELTRTRKLRRDYTQSQYKGLIAALYQGDKTFTIEADVAYRDGRKGRVVTNLNLVSID